MKTYCPICDKMDDIFHCREHFNWEEHATAEKIALVEERRMCWNNFIMNRRKKK